MALFPHGSCGLLIQRAARALVLHRAAGIEQNRTAEIRFFFVFPNEQAVGLAEQFPVDVANVVAGDVLSMLLEFDAEAFVRRLVQARTESFYDLPGENLQVAELIDVISRQDVMDLGHFGSWLLAFSGWQKRGLV